MIHNNNKGVLSFFSIIIIILLSTTHYPRYYCEASYISYGKPNYYQLGDRYVCLLSVSFVQYQLTFHNLNASIRLFCLYLICIRSFAFILFCFNLFFLFSFFSSFFFSFSLILYYIADLFILYV